MSVIIEGDPQQNRNYRQIRIDLGLGNTTFRLVERQAFYVAGRLESVDLKPHKDKVDLTGVKFKNPREYMEAVLSSAIDQILEERSAEIRANAPMQLPEGW